MQNSIPNCKFIFNSRNLENVANSGWWKKNPKEKVIQRLKEYEKLMKNAQEIFKNNSIWVSFDDYIKNPLKLKSLFDFLNAPFDEEKIKSVLSIKLSH